MDNCIFCKIVAGKLSSYKVFENDLFYGFLDIFPRSKGHTLIIPKKHYRWVYDVPEFGAYWETALTVTKGIQKALQPKWVSYLTFGLIVNHSHIHIVPRYDDIEAPSHNRESIPPTKSFDKETMQKIAELIQKEIEK